MTVLEIFQGRSEARSLIDSEEALLSVLSYYLSGHECTPEPLSVFDLSFVPQLSIEDYVRRIGRYLTCSRVCFLGALILIERACHRGSGVRVSARNVHRLFLTALMTSVKFLDDEYYKNSFFASVGGVPLVELNELEVAFLQLIRYRAFMRREDLEQAEKGLIADVMWRHDPYAFQVRCVLTRVGCVRTYTLYGDAPRKELCTETDLVYVPSNDARHRRKAFMEPIGEGRPRGGRQTLFPAAEKPLSAAWPPLPAYVGGGAGVN